MNTNFIITIARQLGSGGREIGAVLAKRMQAAFYDRELITLAAKESGLSPEVFEAVDEKASFSLRGGLLGYRSSIMDGSYTGNYLNNEELFKIQSDVIRELADRQSCVFVGRCADYILRDHPNVLKVFICADLPDRIKRISSLYQLSANKARDLIEKTDKKRAAYYNFYTGRTWGETSSYHLCLNSSGLDIDAAVDFIRQLWKMKYGQEIPHQVRNDETAGSLNL
ncbi:MAG: cytidylate kinase-like family protein [Tannerella sp.]|jgi:cytidylate kinase|nr:cytidylate kinase-like family protein [Tannerella sp.]